MLVPRVLHAVVTTLALAILGCRSAPTITVATDAVFPPFHSVDDSGDLVGFDIEMAREAVRRTGRRATFVRAASYAALYDGLMTGEYDVIAATTGITPERLERYDFTRPYFVTCLAAMIRAGDDEPRTPADLADRPIAASAGTTSARAAHFIAGATVYEMQRAAESLAALRSGQVDAVIIDEFEAVPWAAEADDLDVMNQAVAQEMYGLVLRPDDDELRNELNIAIDSMDADGTLAALRARFGLDRPAEWPVRPRASITGPE